MAPICEDHIYQQDIAKIVDSDFVDFSKFFKKSFLITGASGLIGSFLIDVLLFCNDTMHGDINIYALGRSREKLEKRFGQETDHLHFVIQDVCDQLATDQHFDFVIHGASNTHPLLYSSDPVGTISGNIIGINNLLAYCAKHLPEKFLVLSSVEVYGNNTDVTKKLDEKYYGYIDCNTLRAGYPESKRLCEALGQAYLSQYGINVVVARLSRVYGPTMKLDDSKALSQFIKKAVAGEDIVLKSDGEQFFSYCYVADAVSAILKILADGKNGEAYNVADEKSDIRLKDLAKILASFNDKRVVYEIPDETESRGYSTATNAVMDATKLQQLGWHAAYDIEKGLSHTIKILSGANN